MHILVAGVNHRTAPIDMREQLDFDPAELSRALEQLRDTKSIFETVIVSTCNRSEVYVVTDRLRTSSYFTTTFLADWFGVERETLESVLFIKEDDDAVDHLFRVACGLDSMILGETQILGQVRDGFFAAQEANATGTIFNQLFKDAVTVAKRAHSHTMINDNAVSVSYAAVELARHIFGSLDQKSVLLMGAGEMSELTAEHLSSQGTKAMMVMNRTYDRAQDLANRFSGTAVDFSTLEEKLAAVDIVISSTGARDTIVDQTMMERVSKQRKGRPLFMVDIAVPRDLDPAIHDCDDVFLYDIDDLQDIVASNLEQRKAEAEKIDTLIDEQRVAFKQWMDTLDAVPVIAAMRQKAMDIQSETMESIERKMPDLSKRERKVLNKHTKSIVNQLLREPIQKAKEISGSSADAQLQLIVDLFDIQEEVAEQKERQRNHNDQHGTETGQYRSDVYVPAAGDGMSS
ncbi:glutamyl-tRNA reductase [Tuberibacillus sp. Marseille-P3662]|uniref:glutamyl-tRNA reductase n=1 Tax=Tuberibacillus sp. Marseille-P3662 TaxID=1965358 RepID=UPI000A1CC981|nr:glutamyl-tRNA reductase [Tuberibacillus sp. Marseille-P3662]